MQKARSDAGLLLSGRDAQLAAEARLIAGAVLVVLEQLGDQPRAVFLLAAGTLRLLGHGVEQAAQFVLADAAAAIRIQAAEQFLAAGAALRGRWWRRSIGNVRCITTIAMSIWAAANGCRVVFHGCLSIPKRRSFLKMIVCRTRRFLLFAQKCLSVIVTISASVPSAAIIFNLAISVPLIAIIFRVTPIFGAGQRGGGHGQVLTHN